MQSALQHYSRGLVLILLVSVLASAAERPRIKPGFNLFSKEQDVELGKEAAAQVEQQLPVLRDAQLQSYVESVGRKLAAQPEADKYPYSFKLVHDGSINAFALPGGPVYVHTGLIEAAENEAQVAGVLAHEISHVALRHGTNQASKAMGIQVLAGLLGAGMGGQGVLGQLSQAGLAFGANSVLLKYSRDAERQADLLGARMMAGAGYNPIEMARFFEKLEAQGGARGPQFLSDHPEPGQSHQGGRAGDAGSARRPLQRRRLRAVSPGAGPRPRAGSGAQARPPVSRYDAVLFDFDGVLADTEPVHYACWAEVLRPLGITFDWETYKRHGVGLADRDLLGFLASRTDPPVPLDKMIERYPVKKRLFLERVLANSPIHQPTRDLVKSLVMLRLAVVSSSEKSEVEPVLECAGIRSCFQALVCAADSQNHKPHPEPYLLAASRLQANHPLVVEDSAAGQASGRAAGFDVLPIPEADRLPELLSAELAAGAR